MDERKNLHPEDVPETTIEARFEFFFKNDLRLNDEFFLTQAMKLFAETKSILLANISAVGTGMPEETERYWFAFVLFTVRRLMDNGITEKAPTLCQILRKARLNIVDFFKELPQFLIKVGSILSNLYGGDWEKRIEAKEIQTNFVHLILLSKHYKRAYQQFFLTVDASVDKHSTGDNNPGYVSVSLWMVAFPSSA